MKADVSGSVLTVTIAIEYYRKGGSGLIMSTTIGDAARICQDLEWEEA